MLLTLGQWGDTVGSALPYGQQMAKPAQFAIEVHYVPLSDSETEEKRRRLRALILCGAMRCIERHSAQLRKRESESDAIPLETMRK